MKIVVIGGNAAGLSFAAKYKRNKPDDEIVVLEAGNDIAFGACGLPYYVGQYFDNEQTLFARSVEQIKDSGIDLKLNTKVYELDYDKKMILTEDKDKIYYDKVVIASGASAIVPNFGKYKKDKFVTLTKLCDGKKLRNLLADEKNEHVTIIGAGFIGLEVVDAALKLGKKVTLIEAGPGLLEKQFSKELMKQIVIDLEKRGVQILTNTTVRGLKDDKQGYLVDIGVADLSTNVVVCSIGFRPNTNFVIIDKLRNGAIKTDIYGQTKEQDVYAIGDCATVKHFYKNEPDYISLATVANKNGRILADFLADKDINIKGFLGSSCLKINDFELARTGLSENDAKLIGLNVTSVIVTDKNHPDYYPNQEDIMVKLIFDKESKIIYGCEIIGKSDVIGNVNVIAIAIINKTTTMELGFMDFCYAPPFSKTWNILNVAGNVASKK